MVFEEQILAFFDLNVEEFEPELLIAKMQVCININLRKALMIFYLFF